MKRKTKKEITEFAKSLKNFHKFISSDPKIQEGPSYQTFEKTVLNIQKDEKYATRIRYFEKILWRTIDEGKNQSLLEVGSGYGINIIIFSFLGFKKITGIELIPSMCHNARLVMEHASKYFDFFSMDDCTIINGNAQNTEFLDKSFEAIIAVEVISHVPSLDKFLREINRLLVNDGVFIISDGNNHLCPYYAHRMRRVWKRVREAELEKRTIFIAENYPTIEPQFRASIVLHTELLSLENVPYAVDRIIETNILPMNLFSESNAPIFSESGIWVEYAFNPTKLVKFLKGYGFESYTISYCGGARNKFLSIAETFINRLPEPVKFWFRPTFIINAYKKKKPTFLIDDFSSYGIL